MRIGIDARIIGAGGTGIGRYTRNLIRELIPLSTGHTLVLFLTPEGAAEFPEGGQASIFH